MFTFFFLYFQPYLLCYAELGCDFPNPVMKGFNTTEIKIHSSDGKIGQEEDFTRLRREIYKDLTRQLTGDLDVGLQ